MKASGGRFLLVLGAGLAVMAFVVVYVVMSKGIIGGSNTASVPTAVPMTSVVVANVDVPAYTMLTAGNVGLMEVEATTAQPGAPTDPSSLYGKMTLVNLTKGQQVSGNIVAEAGFSSILKKGQKAFTFAVPERNTFAQALKENDHVDVITTFALEYYKRVPQPDGKFTFEPEVYTSTKTLLQDITVLRVIRLAVTPPPDQQNPDGAEQTAAQQAAASPGAALYAEDATTSTVLILGLTDQQAEALKFARENAIVDFTLRSSAAIKDDQGNPVKNEKGEDIMGDHDVEVTTGIGINVLIDNYGLLAPPAQP